MKQSQTDTLPDGLLVAWYGDDFTGSAAVMEVLAFAGLPAVLFLDPPTARQLERFAGYRAIGIASTARAHSPQWMDQHMPPAIEALRDLNAPIKHYKVCSTFDSAPHVGSIGKAIDIAWQYLKPDWCPLLVAAPDIARYQAFGNLFAYAQGQLNRLDRHPHMAQHPVTPMGEADVRHHLSWQTDKSVGLIDLVDLKGPAPAEALQRERSAGHPIIALDVVDDETLAKAGQLIWENAGASIFIVGSQGVEYALTAHWRRQGLLPEAPSAPAFDPADAIAIASGSCSPVTAQQIDWAEAAGFATFRVDILQALDDKSWQAELSRAIQRGLEALGAGQDPLLYTARGPADPSIAKLNEAAHSSGQDLAAINARVGDGLGRALRALSQGADLRRVVLAGGDTSGYGCKALDIVALTAMAASAPGASLLNGHRENPASPNLEIALKGGQMGPPDFFGLIKNGATNVSLGGNTS